MKTFLKILKGIALAIISLIFVYSGYNLFCKAVLKQKYPLVFNSNFSVVISQSMEPTLYYGDIVVVKKTNNYKVNDIIIFDGEVGTTTHRVNEITTDGHYITKGDNNKSTDDKWLEDEDIYGEVVTIIPKVGYAIMFLKSPPGIIFLIILFAYLSFLPQLIKKWKNESEDEPSNKQKKEIKTEEKTSEN